MKTDLSFRFAREGDENIILGFILELARYERLENEVVATPALLREWLFEKPRAEVLILSAENADVGYMLFYHNFSTFLGRSGIYLEDLYIKPEYRKRGYGRAALSHLASIALQRGCGRLEWSCLDWNEPSIKFYKSLGAVQMEGWTVYRLAGETLGRLAEAD